MGILNTLKIKNTNSKKYYVTVNKIYNQFNTLYKTMEKYSITESLIHIQLAYKHFENTVANEIKENQ